MTAQKSIESYLDELSKEGTWSDFSDFTLDQQSAIRKLSTNLLPDPALWIVKMVQAAVRGRAGDIDVRLGRNVLQVQFHCKLLPTASQIVEHLYSGELSSDPFLLHLTTGLRTAVAQPEVSFVVEAIGPTGREVVAASGGRQTRFQEPHPTLESPRLTFLIRRPYRTPGFKRALDHDVTQLVKGTAEEHLALLTRCWPSPVPIRIDGKLLDTRYDSPLMFRSTISHHNHRQSRSGLTPRINFYLRYYPPENGKPTLPPDRYGSQDRLEVELENGERARIQKSVFLDGRFMEWVYPGEQAGMVLVSPTGKGRRPAIYFVHDGALVQRVPIALAPVQKLLGVEIQETGGGECLIIPVDFDDLDLSQFRVRDVESRREKQIGWIISQGQHNSEKTTQYFKHLYWFSNSRRTAKAGAVFAGLAAVPVGLAFGPIGLGTYGFYQAGLGGPGGLLLRLFVTQAMKQSAKAWEKATAGLDPATIAQPPID